MTAFHKGKRIALGLGLGAISGVTTFYYLNKDNFKVFASWTSNYEPHPCAKWDDNWDHRAPQYIRTRKTKYSQRDENNNENVQRYTPTVCRHLILIRHGQYNLDGQTDSERYLTKLGRLQAEYAGKRLQELNLPYTDMIKSTMTRAQETGSIISQFLPNKPATVFNKDDKMSEIAKPSTLAYPKKKWYDDDDDDDNGSMTPSNSSSQTVPVSNCDLLREGAPIPPEPPLGDYKPERYKFYEDGARIEAAFRKYFHRADVDQKDDSYHVLVCHANVIRYLICRALQVPAEAWLRLSLNHASITWISITPSGRCVLRTMGDIGFMAPNHISS